jgi:hypothetical protein
VFADSPTFLPIVNIVFTIVLEYAVVIPTLSFLGSVVIGLFIKFLTYPLLLLKVGFWKYAIPFNSVNFALYNLNFKSSY